MAVTPISVAFMGQSPARTSASIIIVAAAMRRCSKFIISFCTVDRSLAVWKVEEQLGGNAGAEGFGFLNKNKMDSFF